MISFGWAPCYFTYFYGGDGGRPLSHSRSILSSSPVSYSVSSLPSLSDLVTILQEEGDMGCLSSPLILLLLLQLLRVHSLSLSPIKLAMRSEHAFAALLRLVRTPPPR